MIIELSDITFLFGSFYVEKIKSLSDIRLQIVEESITKAISSVNHANVEEYRYLSVSWSDKKLTTDSEKKRICEILNEIIKDL